MRLKMECVGFRGGGTSGERCLITSLPAYLITSLPATYRERRFVYVLSLHTFAPSITTIRLHHISYYLYTLNELKRILYEMIFLRNYTLLIIVRRFYTVLFRTYTTSLTKRREDAVKQMFCFVFHCPLLLASFLFFL